MKNYKVILTIEDNDNIVYYSNELAELNRLTNAEALCESIEEFVNEKSGD